MNELVTLQNLNTCTWMTSLFVHLMLLFERHGWIQAVSLSCRHVKPLRYAAQREEKENKKTGCFSHLLEEEKLLLLLTGEPTR